MFAQTAQINYILHYFPVSKNIIIRSLAGMDEKWLGVTANRRGTI